MLSSSSRQLIVIVVSDLIGLHVPTKRHVAGKAKYNNIHKIKSREPRRRGCNIEINLKLICFSCTRGRTWTSGI